MAIVLIRAMSDSGSISEVYKKGMIVRIFESGEDIGRVGLPKHCVLEITDKTRAQLEQYESTWSREADVTVNLVSAFPGTQQIIIDMQQGNFSAVSGKGAISLIEAQALKASINVDLVSYTKNQIDNITDQIESLIDRFEAKRMFRLPAATVDQIVSYNTANNGAPFKATAAQVKSYIQDLRLSQ